MKNAFKTDRTYTLTGSQSLNFAEIAAILTQISGKPHCYHNETLEEAYIHANRREK